jgi:hypothetical protein
MNRVKTAAIDVVKTVIPETRGQIKAHEETHKEIQNEARILY